MIELTYSEYNLLKSIFPDSHQYVEIPMIVNQRRGRAWIDNRENPKLGMLYCGDMVFIEGSGEPELIVFPLFEVREKVLEICCDPKFGEAVKKVFDSVQPMVNVIFSHDGVHRRFDAPSEFELRKIDAEIFEKLNETGEDWLVSMFRDHDDFRENCNFGYAALKDGKVVSAAPVFGYDGKRADIGIGTNPAFRNLGLSKACTSRVIAELLASGIEPVWITSPDNIASRRVAERNGFKETMQIPIFWTKLTV